MGGNTVTIIWQVMLHTFAMASHEELCRPFNPFKPSNENDVCDTVCPGVVFNGLRGKQLYPMVSSTAARTGMKLIKSCSYSTSLQFLCCCVLRRIIPPHLDVTSALSLPPGLHDFLVNNLGWLLRPSELGDPAVPAGSGRRTSKRQLDYASTPSPSCSHSSAEEATSLDVACKRQRLAPLAEPLSDFDDVDEDDDDDH